jgi:hypothetical protein
MSTLDAAQAAKWQDLEQALTFAETHFSDWHRDGKISSKEAQALASSYSALREVWVKAEAAG